MLTPDLELLVRETAADRERWVRHLRFDPSHRQWARLPAPDDVDLWLLTWQYAQSTELHDHGDSAAAVIVLRGQLRELRVDQTEALTERTLTLGQLSTVPVGERHDLIHAGDVPAVSLHGYSPRLTSMTYWRREGSSLVPDRTVRSDAEDLVGR